MTTAYGDATSREFLSHIFAIPDGQKIKQCLQCGTLLAAHILPRQFSLDPDQIRHIRQLGNESFRVG